MDNISQRRGFPLLVVSDNSLDRRSHPYNLQCETFSIATNGTFTVATNKPAVPLVRGPWIDNRVWVGTVFTKNRERLLAGDVASRFLARLIATGLHNSGSMASKGR